MGEKNIVCEMNYDIDAESERESASFLNGPVEALGRQPFLVHVE